MASPIRIHLHHKTASSFRSGDTLGGTAYLPPSETTRPVISIKVELCGFVESTARVAHKRRLDKLKESVEAHIPTGAMENLAIERRANNLTEKMQAAEDPSKHEHHEPGVTSVLRHEFGRTVVAVTEAPEGVEFTLDLPTESVAFDGHAASAPPPTCDGSIVWGVEAFVDGKLINTQTFAFMPLPKDSLRDADLKSFESAQKTEDRGDVFTASRTLKLSSNLQIPWGELTSTVSLKQPHTYSRNSGMIQFGLTLDHKAPTGFGRAKEVRVYSCIVDLVQHTTSKPGVGKDNGTEEEARQEDAEEDKLKENEVSLRSQTLALTVDIDPDEPPREFPLMFDLQSTAGGRTPCVQLAPSFETPNVRHEYFLRFVVNPAQNHRRQVARIPIDIVPEEGPRPGTVHGMQNGVVVIP